MKLDYTISLLTSTNKKNFENLSQNVGISSDTLQRNLDKNPIEIAEIMAIAKQIFGEKPLIVVIDDSLIKKAYGTKIEGTQINFDSSNNSHINSLCIVVATLSDGKRSIPVSFKLWHSYYKVKKYELAQQLICELQQYITIDKVLADGLYATKNMIQWLDLKNLKYEMRFHSNRVISKGNQKAQVKDFKRLKPKGKRCSRTIKTEWNECSIYVTAIKHVNSDGSIKFTYQISNYKAPSIQHFRAYKMRWLIEMFFRTAKQSLGLQDCFSIKWRRQQLHIWHVFLAYAILQHQMHLNRNFLNPEAVLRHLRCKKRQGKILAIQLLDQIFGGVVA